MTVETVSACSECPFCDSGVGEGRREWYHCRAAGRATCLSTPPDWCPLPITVELAQPQEAPPGPSEMHELADALRAAAARTAEEIRAALRPAEAVVIAAEEEWESHLEQASSAARALITKNPVRDRLTSIWVRFQSLEHRFLMGAFETGVPISWPAGDAGHVVQVVSTGIFGEDIEFVLQLLEPTAFCPDRRHDWRALDGPDDWGLIQWKCNRCSARGMGLTVPGTVPQSTDEES